MAELTWTEYREIPRRETFSDAHVRGVGAMTDTQARAEGWDADFHQACVRWVAANPITYKVTVELTKDELRTRASDMHDERRHLMPVLKLVLAELRGSGELDG